MARYDSLRGRSVHRRRDDAFECSGLTYASLFAPMKPPSPIDMAPAMSSASPPKTTSLVSPRDANPAVRANGTVMPSETPMMASEIMRGLRVNRRL